MACQISSLIVFYIITFLFPPIFILFSALSKAPSLHLCNLVYKPDSYIYVKKCNDVFIMCEFQIHQMVLHDRLC